MNALADAPAEVTLGYANGPNPFAGAKEVSLYVNDLFVKKLALPDTGAWTAYGTLRERLVLRAGSNDVSIRYDAGDDGNVNLDYLDVTQNEPPQCEPGIDPDDEFDGDALDRCRWTTILNEDPSGYSLADGKLQIKAQAGTSSAARSAHATSCSSGPRPTAAGRRRRRCRSTAPTTTSRPGSSRTRAPPSGASSS